jgi:hypothetical protein
VELRKLVTLRAAVPLALAVAAGLAPVAATGTPAQATQAGPGGGQAPAMAPSAKPAVVYPSLALPGGQRATVFSNGVAEVFGAGHRSVEYRMVQPVATGQPGTAAALPAKPQLAWQLSRQPASPYVPGTLEVVLARGASATSARLAVPAGELAALRRATPRPGTPAAGQVPAYTTSSPLNHLLAGLGADAMSQVFSGATAQAAASLAAPSGLNIGQAYVVHVTGATVPAAVSALLASPAVAYAAPDWAVTTMNTQPVPVPAAARQAAAGLAAKLAPRGPLARPRAAALPALPALPANFALQASEQSLLNRPALDWVPAYEALEARYHQLPGAGETITNVSLGDLDSAGLPASDSCASQVAAFGPTTVIRGGQRYLDLPSMPLIPAWTASGAGTLDPTGEVCRVDPFDAEIGLDFAMMAPLPHSMQRAGELGSGLTDLLGIAPGASYRLVVPSDPASSITSVDEALVAAAQQSPRPNVITTSIGFGGDQQGFPTRYLEDDPVAEAIVSALVHQDHITVSVAAGDGLRPFTNAAVSPSGGAAATGVTPPGGTPTILNDVQSSTAGSSDFDSGSIDAGGVTLDDIFGGQTGSAQPAYPLVRWNGSEDLASGYGPRVSVSAPGDDVIAVEHTSGGAADAVTVVNDGGTSASAQEAGAIAAVVQQAARLAGNRSVATDPLALRSYLARTGSAVSPAPQADHAAEVGPQADLGAAVTGLLAAAGYHLPAGVARVAVAQRQSGMFDASFDTITDPSAISLAGPNQNSLVTIAPDWTGLPAGTSYQLYALRQAGGRALLASGPSARLRPAAILAAAGLSPSAQFGRAVALSYTASSGSRALVTATIALAFTPQSGTPAPLAPVVAPVVTGPVISVRYDLAGQTGFTAPQLVVSLPGRVNPTQRFFTPSYTVPLHATSGAVNIPVSKLQGDGVYGIGIQATPFAFNYSDFAITRVQTTPSDASPAAPLLSSAGSPPGHLLTIGYGKSFTVSWNVRNVPHAAGATLEISAGGANDSGSFALFNNPNGSTRDANGQDSGSVYVAKLTGAAGSVTLSGTQAGLFPSMFHNVRVTPVLASGAAAGEASGVSTITMNGITPGDGGFVNEGFGINANGADGFLTSSAAMFGQPPSSVETFSQATKQVTGTVAADSAAHLYGTLTEGAGIGAGDAGLYSDTTAAGVSYDLLHPAATATAAGQWTPPQALAPAPGGVFQTANDPQASSVAMLSTAGGPDGQPKVFTANLAANTFGPAYPIAPALKGLGAPFYTGITQDTATGTAIVAAGDNDNPGAGPTFVTVNLKTGKTGAIPGVGGNFTSGVAADPATGALAGPELTGIGLYQLATGAATLAHPGGFLYAHAADDPGAREFVVEELSPPGPGSPQAGPDNNQIGAEVVINAKGQLVKRIEKFQFFNVLTFFAGATTQLDPARHEGYTLGFQAQQIEPFTY